jgi:hypothetical protein
MHRGRTTPLGGLALLFVVGCLGPGGTVPDAPVTALKPVLGPQGADAVGLQVAVLEVPVGDRYVNGQLWATIDEQVVAPDRRSALDDNGFRVGVVGPRPDKFDELLNSPRANPEGNSRWIQLRAGHARVLPLGAPRSVCQFRLVTDGQHGTVTAFEKAQCGLQVTPTPTADGVTLAFVPLVQHGTRSPWSAPLDGDDTPQPADRFPALGWEVTVAAKELVIVGTRFDKAGTLGHACLIDADAAKPVQRLLVIQAVRPANPEAGVRSQESGVSRMTGLTPDP